MFPEVDFCRCLCIMNAQSVSCAQSKNRRSNTIKTLVVIALKSFWWLGQCQCAAATWAVAGPWILDDCENRGVSCSMKAYSTVHRVDRLSATRNGAGRSDALDAPQSRPKGYRPSSKPVYPPLPSQKPSSKPPGTSRHRISVQRELVGGVDLETIPVATRKLEMDIERSVTRCITLSTCFLMSGNVRSEYSEKFAGVMPDRCERIEVTVTNDYKICEAWSQRCLKEDGRLMGVRLHHVLLPAPPPLPSVKKRPKRRFREENRPMGPPPLNPGGPLRLREENMIALMTLATEKSVMLLQLRQMKVVGPELRHSSSQNTAHSLTLLSQDRLGKSIHSQSGPSLQRIS